MALERKTSVAVGVATMGLVWGVYSQICPKVTDLKAGRPGDTIAMQSEAAARWASGVMVVGISLLTRDATVFIMGGLAVVSFSWLHRHAIVYDPREGAAYMPSSRRTMHPVDASAGYTPSP